MQSIVPLLILAFVFVLFREPPQVFQLLGLVLSLTGVWVVVTQGSPFDTDALALGGGLGWIFLAVISYALYTALLRQRPPVHPLSLLTATFGLGTLMLAPLTAAEAASGRSLPLTAGSVAAVVYVALVPSLLCYFCYNRGAELVGAARAGQFLHLMPVFGAVLAFFFLGERIHGFHLAGAAFIGAGLAIAAAKQRPGHRQPPQEESDAKGLTARDSEQCSGPVDRLGEDLPSRVNDQ